MSLPPFANEPQLELRRRDARERLSAALEELDSRLPLRAPMLVGEDSTEGDALVSTDPGKPERVVALAPRAGAGDAGRAVAVAAAAAEGWSQAGAERRAAALLAAASWMRERRAALAALCVREAGKPWLEADADVSEAIDFLEYYARGAVALEQSPEAVLQVPGERNTVRYRGRGLCAVIAPWNFPLAIPTGMTAAALATGNSVVLKPAEQAPACGAMVAQALHAGGVPRSVLGLLPGEGDAGVALVEDPRVSTIAFTGSSAVGTGIIGKAASVRDGQRAIKRVVAEMGGKNCVIVDSDADLDETVPALLRSAFAYAGQKCSAASRVLVHEAIAETLAERLRGALDALVIGQADTFGVDVGPLIEREAKQRVGRYMELAKEHGELVEHAGAPPAGGWFVAPALVTGLARDSPILQEEIFGPLLALEQVADVDEALALVRELPFALTGGLFCRDPRTVERVASAMPVGNLYVNRQTTGAMVGRQPFGGNRLSGSGQKAGGPNYLLQFVDATVISENITRHGLIV